MPCRLDPVVLFCCLLGGTALVPAAVRAQTPPPSQIAPVPGATARLRVYLDCGDCFADYLRTEIRWVDFVRQPQDADVQILSASTDTGGGGREVVLRLLGHGRYRGIDHELKAVSVTGDPEDIRRRGVLRTVSVGLLNYIARDGLPQNLAVTVRPADTSASGGTPPRDPWNFWVFSVSGNGSVDAEESNRQYEWSASVSADRVTEKWNISLGVSTDEETEHFDLDEDDPFKVTRRERRADWFLGRSLGPRWSVGASGNVESSTFDNTRFSASFAPAIEFSVFPYAEHASRQLRLQYNVGAVRTRYNEVTLFGKLEETLPRHEASLALDQRQRWGSIEAGIEWSQYLHDRTKSRLEVNGDVSFRIARGLTVGGEVSASRIRDQISLPLRDATAQEVLLRLRELQSGYEVSVSANVTYTFGSIFNNIVNPRFGR